MKWKIYIITHGPIIDEHYQNDPLFSSEHFEFLNVSIKEIVPSSLEYKVVDLPKLKGYVSLGKWWAEAEAIYNVYLNGLDKGYDYIGFLHWDHDLTLANGVEKSLTSMLNRRLQEGLAENEFISFQTADFSADYGQSIMMDEAQPEKLTGSGRNCYDVILSEYNAYCGSNIRMDELMDRRICLCSAFLCSRNNFKKMMDFYGLIINKGLLDRFDTLHQYRFQGGMMERYIGMFFINYHLIDRPIIHRSKISWRRIVKYYIYEYLWRHIQSLFRIIRK